MSRTVPPPALTPGRTREAPAPERLPAAPRPLGPEPAAGPSRLAAYGAAVAAPLLALLVTLALRPYVGSVIFVAFWPAVIAVAAWAGRGPALVASLVSVLLVDWFLTAPVGSLVLTDVESMVPLVAFLVASTVVTSLTERMRLARVVADRSASEKGVLAAELQDQAALLEEQAAELELHIEEAQTLAEELEAANEALTLRSSESEANEQRIRSILEGIADPFVVYDREWRFRYLNPPARRVLAEYGTAADVEGEVLWEAFPQIVGSQLERVLRRATEEGRAAEAETFMPEAGLWTHLSAYPLPDGGVAVQWRDVTERRRAEEAAHFLARASSLLGASLEYERTLADLARLLVPRLGDWAAVDLLDAEGKRQQVAVAHVDPTKIEFVRELNRRYPPDDQAATGAMNVIRTGEPEIYPEIPEGMLEQTAKDAEHLRLIRELDLRSAMVVPMRAQDRVIGALSVVSAESRRRYGAADLELALELGRRAAMAVENARLHREALEARTRAEEANRAKTQFLTVMSHELRTPLNAIAGYAELMALGIRGPITREQKEDLDRISRSQRHLLALINDVLNYARLEGGHVDYDIDTVPVGALLEDIETLVRPQLLDKALSFEMRLEDESLAARADREKARQVLLNLLSNAIKFTASGGRVELQARRARRTVEIAVSDTGGGIPGDKLEAIFEPFVQVGRTLTSPQEGTGLGLAISRDLARGMGGDLRARSEVGEGSTFTLVLPRA